MKLVLLDLDNTLIDAEYRLTVREDEFKDVVQKLANNGVRVGLCSDSAVVTLRQWATRLGLTGPLVAERGAVVWDAERQIERIINISETAWFRKFRTSFVKAVMEEFTNATIVVGDATRFVKKCDTDSVSTEQIFAVNGFRIASFSFFACRPKKWRQSGLDPDPELLKRASLIAMEIVVALGRKKEDLFWDENSQYGILIVHARTTEKWRGVSNVIDYFKPEQTIMVGDGMADFLNLPSVAQYAVGNADPRYKEKATFVAKSPLTEGVIECLRQCV